MNFLIIDDDECKVKNFIKYLGKEDSYTVKSSYNSGLRELILNKDVIYNCLILDMNFPLFDNDDIEVNCGLLVLYELQRRRIGIPTVIYSSNSCKEINLNQFGNIIDTILYGNYDFKTQIENIKNKLKKYVSSMGVYYEIL